MIRQHDSRYEYQITFECIGCTASWYLAEIRPVDIWWQVYQNRWDFYPDIESSPGKMKAKCSSCVNSDAKLKKEERKASLLLKRSVNSNLGINHANN